LCVQKRLGGKSESTKRASDYFLFWSALDPSPPPPATHTAVPTSFFARHRFFGFVGLRGELWQEKFQLLLTGRPDRF
jgi:hypothetical protein